MTTLRDISQAISAAFGVEVADLHGPSRARLIGQARFAAFHMAKDHGFQTVDIGHHFGDKDWSSVAYGIRQAVARLLSDEAFRDDYSQAIAALKVITDAKLRQCAKTAGRAFVSADEGDATTDAAALDAAFLTVTGRPFTGHRVNQERTA